MLNTGVTGVNTKTVKVPGLPDIICVEVTAGQWCWSTWGFSWKFNERIAPPLMNFAMYVETSYPYMLRVESVEVAVTYSIGFSYGYKNGHQHGQEEVKGVEKMVEDAKQGAK